MSIELIALIFLGFLVLGFLGTGGIFAIGLYLGWFKLGSANARAMRTGTFSHPNTPRFPSASDKDD